MRKRILVLGGGGFIGGHLVHTLRNKGNWVRTVDLKQHEYGLVADEYLPGDLSQLEGMREALMRGEVRFDEIYQLAADMGGAGYIFTGENDSRLMQNSASINLNLLRILSDSYFSKHGRFPRVFYSSSACVYPEEIQATVDNPGLREVDAYPANPDSEYGWEKLFSERLFGAYSRNIGLDIRVARLHNIYGPYGSWNGGREKAPAAICRKIALANDVDTIEVWGDGNQTRSFLYIDDCIEAILRLMKTNFSKPINIGSEEMVSINQLVSITAEIAGKEINTRHVAGPLGVRGRNSNNDLVRGVLGWDYKTSLSEGIKSTYQWILTQVEQKISIEANKS
jgi:GDP-D-mannose 3',5'-epimerase